MPIIGAGGAARLSQLQIDAIKDWGAYRIDNLGAPNSDDDVPRARAGDILSGRFVAARLLDGTSGYFLRAAGAGIDPAYALLIAADIPDLDVAKITTGRFGMPRMPAGTSGQVLTAQGAGIDPAYAAAGGAADYPMIQKPALTRWVIPGWYGSTGQLGLLVTAGKIYYTPIFVSETTTYIRISIWVTTAVAGNADLRIYNWSSGVPGTMVLSAGTVSHSTTGVKEITISQQLTRGYYYLAMRCSGAPALYGLEPNSAMGLPTPGHHGTTTTSPSKVILTVEVAFADPAPAPTATDSAAYSFVYLREN